jgi:hypothetical protein
MGQPHKHDIPAAGHNQSLLFNPSRCVEELRSLVKRLGHGSEQHPAWTHVFRVECQTHGAGRPR